MTFLMLGGTTFWVGQKSHTGTVGTVDKKPHFFPDTAPRRPDPRIRYKKL